MNADPRRQTLRHLYTKPSECVGTCEMEMGCTCHTPTTRRHPRTMYAANGAFPRDAEYADPVECVVEPPLLLLLLDWLADRTLPQWVCAGAIGGAAVALWWLA